MAVNFGILGQGVQTPKQGVIANIPASGGAGGGDDIGSLFGALQGLLGKSMGETHGEPNSPIQSAPNPMSGSINQGIGNPQQRYAGIASIGGQQNTDSRLSQLVNDNTGSIWGNASKLIGTKEGQPLLTEYLQKANPGLIPEITPWCAGFVGSVLNASGIKGTGSLAAKSYLGIGTPTNTPNRGDIVVFNDLSGKNDPAHGHVGFVDHIDSKTGMVYTLGGNQGTSVSVKPYPMSAVAGFRVPPSGKDVIGFAKQNGIRDPGQIATIPNRINQVAGIENNPSGMNPTNIQSQNMSTHPAIPLLKEFEGLENFKDGYSHTRWDVNAFRLGYGSDTITKPDGSVVKVKEGMKVTKEDAERDLARRAVEFENTATKQVGADKWSNLPEGAKAALTSVAYNYGSLPTSVVASITRGDSLSGIAGAVRALGSANNGINRGRRNKEADIIAGSLYAQGSGMPNRADFIAGPTQFASNELQTDPQLQNILLKNGNTNHSYQQQKELQDQMALTPGMPLAQVGSEPPNVGNISVNIPTNVLKSNYKA